MSAISTFVAILIIITALIFFIMDFARAKPDINKAANFQYDFGMFSAGVVILLITGALYHFLFKSRNEERVIVLSMIFFLIIFRKILIILAIGFVGYLSAVDNAVSKRVIPKLVIKSLDPSASKQTELSEGALRAGHIVALTISLLFSSFNSAFPGLAGSRIDFTVNYLQKLGRFFVGNSGQRIVFFFWLLFFVIFWVMTASLIYWLYKNFINTLEKKYNEIVDVRPLGVAIIIFFFLRKMFLYIFVSGKYLWEDMAFWWVIFILAIIAIFITYVRGQSTTTTP